MNFDNWSFGWVCGLTAGTLGILLNTLWWVFLPAIVISIILLIFEVTK